MYSEKIIVGKGTEFPLDGLLTLPDGTKGHVPAVVMVHGSGSSNMDEKVMKLTPFRDLAEGLARHGIASIRYDKRSFVHAKKMLKQIITVKEETIDDAVLAINILKSDPRIDAERIFILGHSMGAMLAPRIDSEGGNVRGLILMAGSPYRLEDIMVRQFGQAKGSKSYMKLAAIIEDKVFTKKFDGLYEMSDEEAKSKKFAGGTTLYYFKEMGQKTAADYLLQSEKPVLIMQGGRDFQVLADEDYQKFKELLAERSNTFYKLYPQLNHLFVDAIYDDIGKAAKEYSTERHIGEEVITDIASFIYTSGSDLYSPCENTVDLLPIQKYD
jgi:dienelactone hydrolase